MGSEEDFEFHGPVQTSCGGGTPSKRLHPQSPYLCDLLKYSVASHRTCHSPSTRAFAAASLSTNTVDPFSKIVGTA